MAARPSIICLTPVKNEAWILDLFLRCASLWADHIIVADQDSDDGSLSIAKKYDKVTVIRNPNKEFNEPDRQKLLIDAARQMPSPRFLITLDADEFLTPNFVDNPEWEAMLKTAPGTVVLFTWANIKPGMTQYWSPPIEFPWGFMDDGSMHRGRLIHSPRIPVPAHGPTISIRGIKVMHYQYTDWERMLSKHRWYQCWERINNPKRSAVDLYRQYHHMDAITEADLQSIPPWWFEAYARHGIDVKMIQNKLPYRWDKEVVGNIAKFGAEFFAREYIWDVNWTTVAHQAGYSQNELVNFNDPRGPLLKLFHRWMRGTQTHADYKIIRKIDRILSRIY
jgi:glycosyltransferase involved in cell wall biosynthesis